MGIYFLFLIASAGLAFPLWALLSLITDHLRPRTVWSWQNILRALLRAFPFDFVLAPTLVMTRGLGALIPASLHLLPILYQIMFRGYRPEGDAARNVANSTISLFLFWGLIAMVLFVIQSSGILRLTRDEPRT